MNSDDKSDKGMSEGYQLLSLLGNTLNALLKARRLELEPTGISIMRAWALWVLRTLERPTTIADLSRIMDRDHQTTSQLIKRMETEGLIERKKGRMQSSPVEVSLTNKGNEALDHVLERRELIDDIVLILTQGERDNLRIYLEKLRDEAIIKSVLHQRLPDVYALRTNT